MAKKAATKSEIYANISAKTELTRKQIGSVFDALADEVKSNLGKKGPGIFMVFGLLKIFKVSKPVVLAREGINPFTKEKQMFKAKPVRSVVKVRALKSLKDMVK